MNAIPTAETIAKQYTDVLYTDSPIVSRSHIALSKALMVARFNNIPESEVNDAIRVICVRRG